MMSIMISEEGPNHSKLGVLMSGNEWYKKTSKQCTIRVPRVLPRLLAYIVRYPEFRDFLCEAKRKIGDVGLISILECIQTYIYYYKCGNKRVYISYNDIREGTPEEVILESSDTYNRIYKLFKIVEPSSSNDFENKLIIIGDMITDKIMKLLSRLEFNVCSELWSSESKMYLYMLSYKIDTIHKKITLVDAERISELGFKNPCINELSYKSSHTHIFIRRDAVDAKYLNFLMILKFTKNLDVVKNNGYILYKALRVLIYKIYKGENNMDY